jgi:predicted DNA-binding transcriptional regulator AlpA
VDFGYTYAMEQLVLFDEREELLTAAEVAQILGVSVASMADWLRAGDFPHAYRINPNRPRSAWRIPRSDVALFIQKRREQQGYYYVPVVTGGG